MKRKSCRPKKGQRWNASSLLPPNGVRNVSSAAVGLVYHLKYLEHDTGAHPESADRLKQRLAVGGGGWAASAPGVSLGSYEAALLAAGGAITAVDAVMQGRVSHAFAL